LFDLFEVSSTHNSTSRKTSNRSSAASCLLPILRVYVGSTLTILLLRSHVAKKARAEYVHSQRRPPVKHASFGTIVEDIKADSIQVYYEEGKILIDEDEADAYFTMKIKARLAALKPVAEFA
jgi:hypothetical protein